MLQYGLSDESKGYGGLLPGIGNQKKFPDSSFFQSIFPEGTLRYQDVKSNWQTPRPFTDFEYDRLYSFHAQAGYQEKAGDRVKSDEFIIYRVSKYDTMRKIAEYYGVPLETILFDNKAADMLLVENNTLFIRNPRRNQDTPYQPAELSDGEKAELDSALLGRALHCEFGFEPVNLNTGNFYLAQEDFSYSDSFGTFALQRSYNSKNPGRAGSFGRGFTSLFDESISAGEDGTLTYNREDGSSLTFIPEGNDNYKAPEGYQMKLRREAAGSLQAEFSAGVQNYTVYRYVVTEENNSERIFDKDGSLIQTRGENGETLTLNRDLNGRLTGIIREGVTMGVTATPEGFISSITMPNGGVFRYGYDNKQNLTSVTDPYGNVKRFIYDENHRMTAWYDENGVRVVYNTYDSEGRVTSQINETGGRITLEYGNGKTVAADANGNRTVYEYDGAYRTTAIRYPDGTALKREYQNGWMVKETDRAGVEMTFTYDSRGNITKKEGAGIRTRYAYDKKNHLTAVTDACGSTTRAEYDSAGNLTKLTDGEGNVTAFSYDGRNCLIKQTDANGNVLTYSYSGSCLTETRINGRVTGRFSHDAMGRLTSRRDGAGNTTAYAYDAMGNLITETLPDGTKHRYAYDLLGRLISSADGRGYVTAYGYDKNGNLLKVTDALNQTALYGWDALGRNTEVTDVMGRTTSYSYDAVGNLITETAPDGGITQYAYDKGGRLLQETDALGRSIFYEYDAFDRTIKETDALGGIRKYEYDPVGNLTAFTDELGGTTAYGYDLYGNVLNETDAKGNRTEYRYDPEERLTGIRDAEGNEAELAYDNNGNLIKITDPLGAVQAYSYDRAGRLLEETAPDGGVTAYAYDPAGNLKEVTDSLSRRTAYSYDGAGNVTGITDPSGNQVLYTYDPLNRVTKVTREDGSEDLLAYDPAGNLTAVKESGVRLTKYTYDEMGRLTEAEDALGNKTVYSYDLRGNLLNKTAPDGTQTAYAYDGSDRLIKKTLPNEGAYSYAYDKAGNITKVTGPTGLETAYKYDPAGNVTALMRNKEQKTVYEYDSLNRISKITDALGGKTSYAYDGAGNLTKVTYADGGTYRYRYDKCGRVTGITDPAGLYREFSYDTEGQILTEGLGDAGITAAPENAGTAAGKLRVTAYSYDKNGNLTGVTDPLGGKTAYGYDERDRMVKAVSPGGAETSYEYDSLSDLTAVVNAEGIRNTYTYDIKGRLTGENLAGEEQYAYAYDALDRIVAVSGENSVVTYAYNGMGNLTGVTNGNGGTASYTYDKAGNLTGTADPAGNRSANTYDEMGRIMEYRDENGTVTEYDYDALDRLVRKESGDSLSDASYSYDSMGRLTDMEDVTGKSHYTYDRAGRLLSATDGSGETVFYHYDIYGNVTEVVYPDGRKVSYTYDALDRMTSVTTLEGKTTEYAYDADGNLTRALREDGETCIAYDKLGRVRGLANYHEGEVISAYGYLYDGRGNIIKEETRLCLEEETVEQEYTYEYDGMSQLIRAVLSQTTTTADGKKEKEKVTTTYVYDPAGNRIRMGTDRNGSVSTVTYTYDEAGRMIRSEDSEQGETVYTYDGAGNLIREENAAAEGGVRYYQYDAADRLSAVMDQDNLLLAALYDGNGNRVFTMEYAPELKKNEAMRVPKGQDQEEDLTPSETDGGETVDDKDTESGMPGGGTAGGGETAEGNRGAGDRDKENKTPGNMTGASGGRYAGGGIGKEGGRETPDTRETAALPENGTYKDKEDENGEDPEGAEGTASGSGAAGSDGPGWKAFWYGVLCQAADIFLPAPTPFKAWLHDKMGFRDSVSVLLEKEMYEADLSAGSYSIREEGSPFELVNSAVRASTGKELSSEAYRQAVYVNDVSFTNEQVLLERAVNGSLGESVTGYSYGVWRESYSVEAGTYTGAGAGAGAGMGAGAGKSVRADMWSGSGTYYYTGTGSVANLVTGNGTRGYSYGPGGSVTVYGQGSLESRTNTQAACYGYNGEYTHGSLGLQYLRARYLKVETGTFTSRDTYAGRVRDILSQNRYTYAENNPVTFADPSGHKTIGAIIGNAFGKITQTVKRTADKVTSTVRNTGNGTNGKKRSPDITAITTKITTQATGGINHGLSHGADQVGNSFAKDISMADSVAEMSEKLRCRAYEKCKNDVQDMIRNHNKQETMMLYSMGRMDDYVNGRNVSEFDLSMSERYVAAHGEYNQLPSYGVNNGEDWDRYDTYILAWTNYWNESLKDIPNSKVDPEIVKAMIAQESSMGTKDGYGGASGQNGKRDIMQTLYEYDGAVYTLSKMRFRENYNKSDSDYEKFRTEGTGAYGIPDEGYGFLKPIFSSDGSYDKDAVNPRMSTVAGIRYLSYTTKLKDGDLLEGVGRYNGGGDSDYIQHVFEYYKNGRSNEGIDPFEKYNWRKYINDK